MALWPYNSLQDSYLRVGVEIMEVKTVYRVIKAVAPQAHKGDTEV